MDKKKAKLTLRQVRAKGYLDGPEVKELTDAGVLLSDLAETLGVSLDQIQEFIQSKAVGPIAVSKTIKQVEKNDNIKRLNRLS